MATSTRARVAGILAISLLMLSAPGALAVPPDYLPDAQIRPDWNPTYTGAGVFSTDAAGQAVIATEAIGQKSTFFIKIRNFGLFSDSYKVKRSGHFNAGYRVRYYDAANNDVTGKVNAGTFTTISLPVFGEYVMRATVKVRSLLTPCSSVTRLMTVTSSHSGAQDAVRFTAGFAPSCPPDLTISPGVNDPPGSDSYHLPIGDAEFALPLTFTIRNNGLGASDVLGFNIPSTGKLALANDSCTGSTLPAGGTCSVQIVGNACILGDPVPVGVIQVTGGLPPTIVYLTLIVFCELL